MTRRSFLAGALTAASDFASTLENLRQNHLIAGLSAGIARNQRLVWSQAFGHRDRDEKLGAKPDTPYRIASLTKTFASTLLMQLVEAGKLDLEEPISAFIPPENEALAELRASPGVRIRHVLSHTSQGAAGSRYAYSGLRFSALTWVLEKRSGTSFRQLLAENILDKLKMNRSVPGQDSPEPRYAEALRELAKPYHIDRGRNIVSASHPPLSISASAGLISTVPDLARYDAAIDRNELIRRETQELAWTPGKSPTGQPFPYALGWFVQPYKGTRLIWHYGYWPGSFSSLYIKVLAKSTTLFLLANGDGLSREFPLGNGDVTQSPFARAFLDTVL